MNSEFKKIKNNEDTHYVLETATSGATSAGVIATAPGKRREDSILAQEKKETPKPRNFVAKNAKMGGAGQHKDKKKAQKQGSVKHKKPLAESYAEDLAKQVFSANPNIKDENAVLDAAWPIAVKDLGNKRAMSVFNYDEDFPSDLVSVYGWLQKGTSEGVSDLSYDAQSLITKLRRDVEEKRLKPTPQAVLAAARELAGDMDFAPQLLVKQVLGQGMAEGFNGEYDDEAGMAHTNLLTSARAVMGLLKTIDDKDNLPEWVQEKIAKAEMMLVGVWDYLQSQKEQGIDPQVEGFGKMRGSSSAYDRDYASSVSGMDRGNNHRDDERHDLDPSDWYIVKDGKMYKTSVYPRQEQEAMARGYSRTRDEAKAKAGEQGVVEGERTMSRAAKGNEKYGKDGMKALAKAGREGASDEKLDTIRDKHDNYNEDSDPCWDSHKMVGTKKKGGKTVPNCVPKESVDPYFESLRAKVEELAKK